MLNKARTLKGYKLDSHDGEIGGVREFYFDDNHWTIRYLVADTGTWLTGRQVLISPHALTDVNIEKKHITVNICEARMQCVDLISNQRTAPSATSMISLSILKPGRFDISS